MSQFISLQQGVEMTTLFRENREGVLAEEFQGRDLLPKSESIERELIEELLAQDGCTGIRIYYGMSEDNKIHALLVGYDANDEDILMAEDPKIIEQNSRCPADCPPASELNDE